MCGICGIAGKTIKHSDPALQQMILAMHHRGPDDQGSWQNRQIRLGAVRLAIIDPSPAGHQPMHNADQTIWIAYNGEMYNFREEREILEQQGYKFISNSDTEVILAMYEAYGHDCFSRIRGMFALAIYDQRLGEDRAKLVLARDPLGIKPLLYTIWNDQLWFASELKALLATTDIPRQISAEALNTLFVRGSIAQPLTFIEGIWMLLPGHYLIYQNQRLSLHRYWQLTTALADKLITLPYPDLVARLKSNLEETIRGHLISDVPVGAFLSGGVDSAALVALAQKILPQPIQTFSIGFGKEGTSIDETDRAQYIADHLGTQHTRVNITGHDVKQQLREFVKALDQPSIDGLNSFLVAKATKPTVTVALSGLGGDEIFAGYPWFGYLANFAKITRYPALRLLLLGLAKFAAQPIFDHFPVGSRINRFLSKIKGLTSFNNKFSADCQILSHDEAQRLIDPQLGKPSEVSLTSELRPSSSPLQQASALILRSYTQNQLLRDVDTVSMFHSLEVRVPFLDTKLIELAINLPDYTKLQSTGWWQTKSNYRTSGSKRILIDAVRELLPPDIDLIPKFGFGLPLDSWLRTDLADTLAAALAPEIVQKRGLFRPATVTQIYRGFLKHRVSWAIVWLLMITELWCQEFLDTPANNIN